MKAIYLIMIGAICLLYSCSENKIPTYYDSTSERFIYFAKSEADSSEISFFSYPGRSEILLPVIVQSTGISDKNEAYEIVVRNEFTTAPAETFNIPNELVIKAGEVRDTCLITLKYTPLLDTEKIRLVINVANNENFSVGRTEYRAAVIWFHNIISQPQWWTGSVTSYYLGTYSDKKYRLFLEVVGVDMTGATDSELRHYALIFKSYLNAQKAAGNTIEEENGTEMTVAVTGNLT